MKHPIYHTKRFWKLVEKEFMTNTQLSGNLFIFLCHGSPTFKEQWQLRDFREFCRAHAKTVLGSCVINGDEFESSAGLCAGDREPRLRFLTHMVKTISLRTCKSL